METQPQQEMIIQRVQMSQPFQLQHKQGQLISLRVPQNRVTPLKKNWQKICQIVVDKCKLNIRMNPARKTIDIKESQNTIDNTIMQKAADFLKAFILGFSLQDALALLRIDDLFVQSFKIKDVKTLKGQHLSRCIARISGQKGKTKNAVQNSTRTRIVLADSNIHIMGSFHNIKSARTAICNLIIGSPAGKVYSQLRTISKRLQQRL